MASNVWRFAENGLQRLEVFAKHASNVWRFGKTALQGLEVFPKHASKVWRNGENGLQGLEGGFTLVEVLCSLGILLALACVLGGGAVAVRVAEERARDILNGGRAVASLYAEARMEGPGADLEVPGGEGAWAVAAERGEPWTPWMGGFGENAPAPAAAPSLWRIDARERRPGGFAASLELAEWPAGGPS